MELNTAHENVRTMATMKVIWHFMVMTEVFFVGAAWIVVSAQPAERASQVEFVSDPVSVLLTTAAGGAFVVAFLVHRLFKTGGRGAARLSSQSEYRRLQPGFIVRLALFDAVGCCGMAVAIVRSQAELVLPFVALAVGGLALSFPSRRFLDRLAGTL